MKELRHGRSARDRKSHLSPDAERLVAASLGLASSGSRVEDRYWDGVLAARIEKLLESGHGQAVEDALDRTHQTDNEAYGVLIEAVETAAESLVIEHEGVPHDVLLVTAPLVAWTRFRIPAGPLPVAAADALAAHWQAHVLAKDVRFRMSPFLYSIDQLPRDFAEVRRLAKRLGQAALGGTLPRPESRDLPETADMLADSRFLVAAVAVPQGRPMFRWQELDARDHASRVACLESWVAQGRPSLESVLAGCGFECLLPDGYHINLRETDRRVRPFAIRAGVHFLTHVLDCEARDVHAAVMGFGEGRVDEYRIGLCTGDGTEVAHGITWPMLGAEQEDDEPSPLEAIKETLRESGITEIRVWPELVEPDFCEDCGAPLFPNMKGEVVHADEPGEQDAGAPAGGHFH